MFHWNKLNSNLQRMPSRLKSSNVSYSTAAVGNNFYKPAFNADSPMYKHQNSLKYLPVPKLEETCERYYKSLLPLFKSEEEEKNSRNAIDKFLASSQAKDLQQRLLKRSDEMAKVGRGWLIDWWNDAAYMAYRDSVVINVSYFFQFVDDKFRRDQISRAAAIIDSGMKFRELCTSQTLEADMAGRGDSAHGLCMQQYQYMFNSCRIPEVPADTFYTFDPKQNNHVAVVRKGKFYTFSLVNSNGGRLSTADIEVQLKKIKIAADADGFDPHPLGAMTTQNRDIWDRARRQLLEYSPGNKESLAALESSVFLICLDDYSPLTREEVGRALWHGDGKNRYFDKTLQFVVFENGKAGFNGEHSMMDATPTFRLCEFVCDDTMKAPPKSQKPSGGKFAEPKQLLFQYPDSFDTYVASALTRFDNDVFRHDHKVLASFNYGKNQIKKFAVSPDAFVQLSIQLAFYKLFGECRATYESAQTKKYAWGRTETCRSVSEDSVKFVKAAADPSVDPKIKANLARKAISTHTDFMAAAVDARGVDRHFLGLRKSLKPGETMPEIFKDPLFARSCHWNMSTSQISSEYFDGYGWGEVVPDGYGIAYMVNNNSIHYNVASLKGGLGWEDGPGSWKGKGKGIHNPCQKMAACLEESLFDLKQIFEADLQTKTKAKL